MKLKFRSIAVFMAILLTFTLFPGASVFAGSEDEDEGYKDGYSAGWTDGMEAAWDDLDEGNRKSYSKAIPSNKEIKDLYELDEESNDYEDGFLTGYRAGFREGYEFGYENPESGAESKVAYDEELGESMGEISGKIDYYAGKKNEWNLSVPSKTDIIQIFGLKNESEAYKNDFINNFRTFYRKGYEYGYRSAKFAPIQTELAKGDEDGKQLGELLGANYGRKDYYASYASQWERDLPTDNEIMDLFRLKLDSEDYMYAFLSAFKAGYETKYEEAYRQANVDSNLLLYEQGFDHGKEVGAIKGESLAKLDRAMNLTSNDTRNNISDKDIIKEFMLFNTDARYRDGFLSGYREGLKTGYLEEFQNADLDYATEKVVTQIVPISGAEVESGDKLLLLTIEKGMFFNDTVVTIDKMVENNSTVKLPDKSRMTRASELYTVALSNYSGSISPDKTVELKFDYYGPNNGGIYKYTKDGWLYMPSRITEDGIATKISSGAINKSNNTYAVFIDNAAWNPNDLRGNWARDEIIAYLRRGKISAFADRTFRPDYALTQGQATAWLNTIYNAKLTQPKNPNATVTYTALEGMMRQASGDKSFSWAEIAEKMAQNKDKRSGSYSGMNKAVTRAEAIYMLYYVNE